MQSIIFLPLVIAIIIAVSACSKTTGNIVKEDTDEKI